MSQPRNPNVFEPPTADQLAEHLAANPPAPSAGWRNYLPIMILAVVGLAVLASSSPALALLPWVGLLGAMMFLSGRVRAAQALEQRVMRAWELSMIRRYREALGRAWDLLPACRTRPELHGRVVTVMAHILGELGCDEAAEVAYGYLLDRLPPDHPLALRLRVQRAIAALRADRLADADDALRKLRAQAEGSGDDTLAASYRMARLVQDVRTGHFADAAEQADQTADALRPLGVEAGYGHGLLALCFHQLALHDPAADAGRRQQLTEAAGRWWRHATLLIPPSALMFRHAELAALDHASRTPPGDREQAPAS